jgi:hypothetical protein
MRHFLDCIEEDVKKSHTLQHFQIKIDKTHQLSNNFAKKCYKNDVSEKRIYDPKVSTILTFPYGYVEI